ncbi:hypothetical protein CYJ25_01700 [Schaalia turicensis]|uniref:Head-to-tail adaptor n=1 Tax=Schaalia turicensis TaxID=131111 RepID=A0A2I1I773_9ACTO|nr:hypothetical protein [Schaalia turicensis]PKY66980.1 hypothetical protein CYJ25_01700 [Schaalia turicensis]
MTTLEDWQAWAKNNGEPTTTPENMSKLLRSADRLLALTFPHALMRADEGVRALFVEAACVQAMFWHDNQITPFNPGVTASSTVASSSLLSGSVSFAGAETTVAARNAYATRVCPEAVAVLKLAGVYPAPVGVIG